MPTRARRPCAAPSCSALVTSGYCPAHAGRARPVERWRGSATERGYDGAWRRFRRAYLAKYPTCADCQSPATEVHHVEKIATHPQLRLVASNCRALCKTCHSRRTAAGE